MGMQKTKLCVMWFVQMLSAVFFKKQVFNLFPSGRQELADKADTDLKLYWYWVLEIIVSFGGKGQGQQKDNIISAVVNSLFRVTTWTVLSATSNLKLNSLNHWLEDDWLLHWWFAHQFSAMPELKRAIYVHNRLLTFCKFMKQIIQAMCITQLEGSTTSIHFFYLFLQCSSDMKTEVQIVALIWCLKIETSFLTWTVSIFPTVHIIVVHCLENTDFRFLVINPPPPIPVSSGCGQCCWQTEQKQQHWHTLIQVHFSAY